MLGDGMDASKDVLISSPVNTFETEEQCHNHLRILHKEDVSGSSLIWDDKSAPSQLLLLTKDKWAMWKCVPASIKAP